jgi:hypothetical protein
MTASTMSRVRPGARLPRRRRKAGMLLGAVTTAIEALAIVRLGYPPAGNVVVRCREGHLFTTLWVPGASVKSARLGWWRVQRCPVGRHWSLVHPVRRADLSPWQRRAAGRRRDIRVP